MGKKKSLTNLMLLVLENAVDGFVRLDHFINNPHLYAYYGWWDRPLKKTALAVVLTRLRENGMIDFVDEHRLVIRLTDEGKDKALWTRMRLIDEKWDEKWRLVIWDIPEKKKKVRDTLRFKLKYLGFTKLQDSVWFSKKNCTKELREYIRKIGISDWVKVIESDNIGI